MNTARQTLASGLQRPRDPGCARSGSCDADAPAFGCFLYGGNRGFCSAPPRPAPSGFGKQSLRLRRWGPCGQRPVLQVRRREVLPGQDPGDHPVQPLPRPRLCASPTRAGIFGPPPFSPLGLRPEPRLGGCRGRGASRTQARGRRRHHVSGQGWRERSGPGPAPRA